MIELTWLALSGLSGLLLGLFFFGGLKWTIQKGLGSHKPMIWFAGGWLVRMACVVTGFYFISALGWQNLLVCLAGFLVARVGIIRFTRSTKVPGSDSEQSLNSNFEGRKVDGRKTHNIKVINDAA